MSENTHIGFPHVSLLRSQVHTVNYPTVIYISIYIIILHIVLSI